MRISAPLSGILRSNPVVILDGGLATELEARGADLSGRLWSARLLQDNPELIAGVHRAYFEAGADVAITASYQASFEGLAKAGYDADQSREIIRRSVSLAQTARAEFWAVPENRQGREYPLIAVSIGPYGAYLADGSEYAGNYGESREALRAFHEERMQILAGTEPDLLAVETIPSLLEAEVLAELLSVYSHVPAWMTFSCRNGTAIADGASLRDAVQAATSAPTVIATGVNCTPPRYVSSLLDEAAAVTDLPLVAYPNSGESWDDGSGAWRPADEQDDIAALALDWYRSGARLIGGCCRTGPGLIRQLRRLDWPEPAVR